MVNFFALPDDEIPNEFDPNFNYPNVYEVDLDFAKNPKFQPYETTKEIHGNPVPGIFFPIDEDSIQMEGQLSSKKFPCNNCGKSVYWLRWFVRNKSDENYIIDQLHEDFTDEFYDENPEIDPDKHDTMHHCQ